MRWRGKPRRSRMHSVADNNYLHDLNHALSMRRTKLRKKLLATEQIQELELLCAALLGTTVFGGNTGELKSDA